MEKRSQPQYYIWIVYLNIVLYATCYQLQRPLEPFLVEKLKNGGSAAEVMQEYATLQSFFSILQTLGSLIAGKFVDSFGVKGGFYVSFGASALSYGFLSQATNLQMLYISKIPTIFQAGFLCAQVAASQLTNDGPERVKALGLLTTSYTIGSVIGPSIGGMLGASGDYYLGAKLAVAGSILSMVLTYLMPSTEETPSNAAAKSSTAPAATPATPVSYWNMQPILDVLSVVWLFLAAKVISSTANAISFTAFPIVLKNTFLVDEKGLGFAMSFLSACNAIVNGILLEPIVQRIGKGNLMVVISTCLIAMTILFVMQGSVALPVFLPYLTSYGLYPFLASSVLLSIFQYVLATTITSESTARVNADAKGTLLGLEHSLFAAARIITPQIGISLLQQGGITYVAYACAGVYAVVTGVWYAGKENASVKKPPAAVNQEWKEK